jgi:hypothetical protein
MVEHIKVRRFQHLGKGIVWILLMLFVGALLLLWSWDIVVSGIFGLPNLQFKQALALEVLFGVFSFPFIGVRLWSAESDLGRKGT